MNPPPEIIRTNRLVLRPPVMEDALGIFEAYCHDPEVVKYMVWPRHPNVEETRRVLPLIISGRDAGTEYAWILEHEGAPIGMVSIRPRGHKADIGYVMARSFWGQGLMTEAVAPIVEWAWAHPEIFRLWAICDVDNIASARVLEKVGLSVEGTLRRWSIHPNISPKPRDMLCYAKVR
jgi:RimJ/RimL family protein N-acetyltransferase